MSYPRLKIAGREIIALIPSQLRALSSRADATAELPEFQQLLELVREQTDAIAFGFLRGSWYPAA